MITTTFPYGRLPDGRMVSVDDVPRGKDCGAVCLECSRPLVAAKGEIVRHYFRHYAEGSTCHGGAPETITHSLAKQLIADNPAWLYLPNETDLGPVTAARQEATLFNGAVRADALIDFKGEPVAIEIWVAHECGPDKVAMFAERKHAAVEIDLRRYKRRLQDMTSDEQMDVVFADAPRKWLYPPAVVRHQQEMERLSGQVARVINDQLAQRDWRVRRAEQRAREERQAERERARRAEYERRVQEQSERERALWRAAIERAGRERKAAIAREDGTWAAFISRKKAELAFFRS